MINLLETDQEMRKILTVALLCISVLCYSQTWNDSKTIGTDVPKMEEEENPPIETPAANDDKIYDVVEWMPSFPGGMGALMSWIGQNIKYPAAAATKKISGRVIVQFVVEKDGSISNVKVAKSVVPLLDAEAMRVVRSMPKWIPGKQYQYGEAVRVKYTVPVTFHL